MAGDPSADAKLPDVNHAVVLDIEASGLPPGSFPVEVGITFVATGVTRS